MFHIVTDFLEHDSGTKFYETVQITEENGPAILIKRWGKIGQKMGGGQFQIERGSKDVVSQAALKILAEKRRDRPGKGRYDSVDAPAFGLHPSSRRGRLSPAALYASAETHFDAATVAQLVSYFGLTRSATGTADDDIVDTTPAPEEPVVRDDTWASW